MANSVNSTGRWFSSLNDSDFTAAQKMDALNQLDHTVTMALLPVTVFVVIETVVGFFGNIIVLYVFLFHYKPSNFRLFVLWLGVTDLIGTVTTMPGEVISQLYWYRYPDPILCKIRAYSNAFTMTTESLVLLAITTERYCKVCRPLDRQISDKAARYIVIAIFTFAPIFSIPVLFLWSTYKARLIYQGVPVTVTICKADQKVGRSAHGTYSFIFLCVWCVVMTIMFVLCWQIARRLLCQWPALFSRSKRQPASKAEVIHASNVKDGDQLSNPYPTAISEEIRGCGVSPSDDLLDVKSDDLGVKQMAISGDRPTTSDVECSAVERKEGNQSKHGHGHKNQYIAQKIKRVRKKTIIMFVLTVMHIVTWILFLSLLHNESKGILLELNDAERATYFFFLRLYFINHLINPIIYGVLDPQFKNVIIQCLPFQREERSSSC